MTLVAPVWTFAPASRQVPVPCLMMRSPTGNDEAITPSPAPVSQSGIAVSTVGLVPTTVVIVPPKVTVVPAVAFSSWPPCESCED